MNLGDLFIVGEPPAKFLKALAVIADSLHPVIQSTQRTPRNMTIPGISQQSCVLCSLVVREFLFKIGFRDVEVRPVFFAMRARRQDDGQEVHSLGIGHPDSQAQQYRPDRWDGHMVVIVPSVDYLIDTTLYAANRPIWPELPGMLATPLLAPDDDGDDRSSFGGMQPVAGVALEHSGGLALDAMWFDQSSNRTYRKGPDFTRRAWRAAMADRLVQQFGRWDG